MKKFLAILLWAGIVIPLAWSLAQNSGGTNAGIATDPSVPPMKLVPAGSTSAAPVTAATSVTATTPGTVPVTPPPVLRMTPVLAKPPAPISTPASTNRVPRTQPIAPMTQVIVSPPVTTAPVPVAPIPVAPLPTVPASVPAVVTSPPVQVQTPVSPPRSLAPPTAQPVRPTIPSFDPAPILQAERTIISAITNSAAEDEIILELKYDDIELLDLIKSLALQADVNILFDPTFANRTTPDGQPIPQPIVPAFRMSNVTAKQALEAILTNYSLQMVHDPKTSTYRVGARPPDAKPPMMTKIIQLKYTNPTNLLAVLTAVVGEGGKVTPEARTQQLIITAVETAWDLVMEVLDKMDAPTPQVLIEANIMETSHSPTSLRGIDWSGTLQAQTVRFGNGITTGSATSTRPGAQTTTTTTLPGGRTVTSSSGAAADLTETLTTAIGSAAAGGLSLNTRDGFNPTTGFLNADGLSAVLSFLNTDASTEVISTPRVTMRDGETARLSVTRAFPIFEITPGTAQTPAGSTVVYTNMGTILEVTPRVAANSNIALKVIPEVSNIDSKDRQTINGLVNEANVYAVRRMETTVTIPSGYTLVMGGLISDTQTKQYTKVPLLGDIPGLGGLFRRESKARSKANLLIFVTPTILEPMHFQPPMTDFLHGIRQPTAEDFLRTPLPEKVDDKQHFMDAGRPYDWKKQNFIRSGKQP